MFDPMLVNAGTTGTVQLGGRELINMTGGHDKRSDTAKHGRPWYDDNSCVHIRICWHTRTMQLDRLQLITTTGPTLPESQRVPVRMA